MTVTSSSPSYQKVENSRATWTDKVRRKWTGWLLIALVFGYVVFLIVIPDPQLDTWSPQGWNWSQSLFPEPACDRGCLLEYLMDQPGCSRYSWSFWNNYCMGIRP